jgi:site-specific DNA recombinase
MRAAAYVRISRDEEGLKLGIKRQEQDCRELAASRGWKLERIYSDNDITASGKHKRPGWEALLEGIRLGEVEAVVAYSSSRLYRNVGDWSRLLENKPRVATVASGDLSSDTADSEMQAGILAVVDQAEWRRTSERVTRKREELKAEGKFLGSRVPFGYRLKDGFLVVETEEAKVIQEAAKGLLNGQSLRSVAQPFPITLNAVRFLFQRDNPGILTKADANRVRKVLDDPARRTAPRRKKYLLTGLLECGLCGGRLKGSPRAGVPRYVCNKTGTMHLTVKADPLEAHMYEVASGRRLEHPEGLVDPSEPLVKEREAIEAKLAEMGESDLAVEFVEARVRKLTRELERIDSELGSLPAEGPDFIFLPAPGADADILDAFRQMPIVRAWLETLVERITVAPSKGPGYSAFDPGRISVEWRPGVV